MVSLQTSNSAFLGGSIIISGCLELSEALNRYLTPTEDQFVWMGDHCTAPSVLWFEQRAGQYLCEPFGNFQVHVDACHPC